MIDRDTERIYLESSRARAIRAVVAAQWAAMCAVVAVWRLDKQTGETMVAIGMSEFYAAGLSDAGDSMLASVARLMPAVDIVDGAHV